jgi:hypothetical protein
VAAIAAERPVTAAPRDGQVSAGSGPRRRDPAV